TGYSATSIYLYFRDKDDLFHALIEEGYEALNATFKAIHHATADVLDRFRQLCRAYLDFGLQNPEYYEIMFLLHPEHMARYPADKFRKARQNLDVLAQTLTEGVQAGLFKVDNPRVWASTIWASLHGTVSLMIAHRLDIRIDKDEFVETSLRHVVQGVQAPA
ncbi:MAG: TetR-like C-terminal domain-containing protein, partial [Bacteroidota bacterium]